MKIRPRTRQIWELFKHPKLFPQNVILSDGGVMQVYSLSQEMKTVKLLMDSGNHPSWNSSLTEHQSALSKHGRIMKFNEHFGDLMQSLNDESNCNPLMEDSALSSSSSSNHLHSNKNINNYSNIPILEEPKTEPSEPAWMKYKKAAAAASLSKKKK